ncbi:lipid IV(A) 3-deoxy-D-manno-octulosonic acid transferase [Paraferrimonas sp. SM1919]|uniref:lipid IV(A) 3-deoxy-D-manno-octulosonic acid transferase n=1 Tax=Paraferrimonas sp. SM1919 TaxID=2662263 RepID=UPI0013D11CB8|nr:lipid IV(A) 3-deoxy-D-manno-octulosonic acid transferase [Paraferrimonas sp. SM1919]
MARIVYSTLLFILTPLLLVYLRSRSKKDHAYNKRKSERFGLKKLQQTDLLIHAVSMGEAQAAFKLLEKINHHFPQLSVTFTCSSPTASSLIQSQLGDKVQHCYLPFDVNWCVKRFVKQVKPKACIIMETELWPNLIHQLKTNGCHVALANGRLSEKSFHQYQKFSRLTANMLKKVDLLLVQTDTEVKRFVNLGADPQKCHSCGSIKFDISPNKHQAALTKILKANLNRPVWVAGSVHPGEFKSMLKAHKKLLETQPNVLLILCPRHPEAFSEAQLDIIASGLTYTSRSVTAKLPNDVNVILGDSMGELMGFYGIAQAAFVGGSLINNGGHNPLEPAAFGIPVSVGPYHHDFLDIVEQLEQTGGLQVCPYVDSFEHWLLSNFEDQQLRQSRGLQAMEVVARNQGASQKQFDALLPALTTAAG